MFKGREDEDSREVVAVLAKGKAEDPEARCTLSELAAALSRLLGEPIAQPPAPPARFWTEDQVVRFRARDYRIVSHLGSGGVGTTFKVVEIDPVTNEDRGAYVAKSVLEKAKGERALRTYGLARSHLRHSALSTIYEVASEWSDNNFAALMTWIEGAPLNEYTGVLQLLAEDQQEESDEALAGRWLRTTCEALDVLHRNGLVHGDVSPRNLIVSGTELVLTDYDCVGKIGEPVVAPGTVLYCAPVVPQDRNAAPSDDLYALAASFFEVLFDRAPFQYGSGQAKERGLNWAGVEREKYPVLAPFLDQATHPNPNKRYATAAEAMVALSPYQEGESRLGDDEEVGDGQRPGDERHQNEVPWLKSLLRSYPGSRWGNRETRGLDTDFAEQTYVETPLEEVLRGDIVELRTSLVVLCGNAGDGKTALLQHLAEGLGLDKPTSATRILEGRLADGLTVRMNLDGSASWKESSADQLLDKCLVPFQQGRPAGDQAFLLAINDGRLLEWIENVEERRGPTPLTKVLADFLANEASPSESHIRFVNLNQRSLVGGIASDGSSVDTSFLERLVNSLYGAEQAPRYWTPCQTCSAQERCEVFRAARLFAPDGVSGQEPPDIRRRARQRLFDALQAVHLRGETHITIRELRAALVYILFGIHYCRDYHEGNDGEPVRSYADRAFSPESPGRQGEVLRELVHFDPALEAHPQIDRQLLHSPDNERGALRHESLPLEQARRHAYFEWPEERIENLTGDPNALSLAQGAHLRWFRDLGLGNNANEREHLTKRLCVGISRLETLPPQALNRTGVVPLRITPRTPTETAFWIEKPVRDFRLEADVSDSGEGLDRLHRQVFLVYRYRDGREERLRLGADLFHLLLELGDGYQLGDISSDDAFAHLSIFVQRLAQEDHRRAFAWNPMEEGRIYEVSANVENPGSISTQRLTIAPLAMEGSHGG